MSTSQSLDGIEAFSTEKGNGNTITLLNKDNYLAWSCKVEGQLDADDLWENVSGQRKAPIVPAAVRNANDTAIVNQAEITAKEAELKIFIKDSKRAASYLLNMISDGQLFHVRPLRTDPIAMWQRLKDTFERTTEMTAEAAQMQLLNFAHIETENADQTIERYVAIVEFCGQQGVAPSELLQQRMLLSRPNARYNYLKKYVQHSDTLTDIQKIFRKMRDDDTEHQVDQTPLPGSAAFLEAVQNRVEIMWAQKLSKEGKNHRGGGGNGGSYKADSNCFNCGQK